jgi:PilZ domain
MTMTDRRGSRRYPTDWLAQYRYDPSSDWRPCRVVNVSRTGAEVELGEPLVHEPVTGLFFLQVRSVAGDEVGVTIRAHLRRRVRTEDGRAVAGIEFQPLDDHEASLFHLLIGLRTSA